MNRREALSAVTIIMGGTIIGAEAFLTGCSPRKKNVEGPLLTEKDINLLNEVGETILPHTNSSPGAKEANVGEFMKTFINDCYTDKEQKIFVDGLSKLNLASDMQYAKGFTQLDARQKEELLLALEKEAAETRKQNHPDIHYYTMIKQLTLTGFLTSEVGATKALRHVAVPGRYEGCIPLQPGEKAWG